MNDEELLKKIKCPETESYAFNLLMREHQEKVYMLARRMVIDHDEANDIVQEVFIKVYQHIHTFHMRSKLFTWIYRIAFNECLSTLKKKKRKFFLPLVNVTKELEAKIDCTINVEDIQKKLQKAILTLPKKQRIVFMMRYYDDLSYKEIAEIMNKSEGGIKANYHHATTKIENFLMNH